MLQTRCLATTAVLVVNIGWPEVSIAATLNVPTDYPTIQACIDAAVSGVDECVAVPGTYHETINFLGKAITLRSSGGADVTIIDGSGLNSSVVTCATGEGPKTVLDGFTITGGIGTTLPNGYRAGGGMYNAGTSVTIINCIFSRNEVGFGAMYNSYSDVVVTNCTFIDNLGVGMYNERSSPDVGNCVFTRNWHSGMYNNNSSNPLVTECTFSDNQGADGSGMHNAFSDPTVIHCMFTGNMGYHGGAMLNLGSNPKVVGCSFEHNIAEYAGGGIFNYGSSNPQLSDCSFISNASDVGGAIHNDGTEMTIDNCIFTSNTASFYGGGISSHMDRSIVSNCTFSGNTAWQGGGIYSGYSNSTIANCTFGGNKAQMSGGAIYNYNASNPTITDCILWGNSPNEVRIGTSSPILHFTNIQGGLPTGSIDGGGNIDLDPMFVRPPNPGPDGTWDGVDDDYGDLRLLVGSPCINAGDPAFIAQPGETDLEGHARVLCGRVDMGAYEFGIGDYDCDQSVDLTDFVFWCSCMTGPSTADTAVAHDFGCGSFDFDGDGDVDLFDFGGYQRIAGP